MNKWLKWNEPYPSAGTSGNKGDVTDFIVLRITFKRSFKVEKVEVFKICGVLHDFTKTYQK